jgi:glycosyltransferase involved in cell wall biosynthesis
VGRSPASRTHRLRLLVVNWQDRANPRAGGAEIHLHQIFGRLARRGHCVTLVTSGWPGSARRETIDLIQIHRVGGRHTFGIWAPLYCRRTFDRGAFDVVVEDLNKVPVFAPLWAPWPVMLIAHHLFGFSAFGAAPLPIATATWALEKTLRFVYRGIPTQAVSESTAEDLCRCGLQEQDIAVIHNGVDFKRFVTAAPRAPDPTVLYLGRLQRYKRVDLILRAVAHLRQVVPNMRLLVAGRGPDEARLRNLASALGLTTCVAFIGYVTEDEKRDLFGHAWVHAIASGREGWGISILEAAAAGTPTVASDSPGLRDAVRDGTTGLLVPHGDVAALAGAMASLLSDHGRLEQVGRGARCWARQHSWDRAVLQTERHLLDVANERVGSAGYPLRMRRRDGRALVPLPRNGTDAVPFGWSRLTFEARGTGGAIIVLRVVLGARDRMGHDPVLVVESIENLSGANVPPGLRDIVGHQKPLDGWPSDPGAFIASYLSDVGGLGWDIIRL